MKNIVIGPKSEIDKTAIIGYKTGRSIMNHKLAIGKGAKVRSGTVIYEGSSIGDNLETGHNAVIREENLIGNNLSLWSNSVIDYGCKIGNNVKIHSNCYIAQATVIEDNVFMAPGVMIANDKYPVSKNFEGPVIKKGAKIGINVTVLPGVTIGPGALIGAGAVVANDIPAKAIAYGNPAEVKKYL